jgi:hypothetical protein
MFSTLTTPESDSIPPLLRSRLPLSSRWPSIVAAAPKATVNVAPLSMVKIACGRPPPAADRDRLLGVPRASNCARSSSEPPGSTLKLPPARRLPGANTTTLPSTVVVLPTPSVTVSGPMEKVPAVGPDAFASNRPLRVAVPWTPMSPPVSTVTRLPGPFSVRVPNMLTLPPWNTLNRQLFSIVNELAASTVRELPGPCRGRLARASGVDAAPVPVGEVGNDGARGCGERIPVVDRAAVIDRGIHR